MTWGRRPTDASPDVMKGLTALLLDPATANPGAPVRRPRAGAGRRAPAGRPLWASLLNVGAPDAGVWGTRCGPVSMNCPPLLELISKYFQSKMTKASRPSPVTALACQYGFGPGGLVQSYGLWQTRCYLSAVLLCRTERRFRPWNASPTQGTCAVVQPPLKPRQH